MSTSLPASDYQPNVGKVPNSGRIEIIDTLRGLAAFSVLWYHLSGFKILSIPGLHASGSWGWLGVQTFFVISGFVLPYAFHQSRYSIGMFGTFLLKRITRLEPPYLVTLALILAYSYLVSFSRFHQGDPINIGWARVLAHLAYINAFIGMPWFSESFWTLAVEFEYYLALGLVFPLTTGRNWKTAVGLILVVGAGSFFFPASAHLAHHAPVFLFGLFVFRYKILAIGLLEFSLCLVCCIALTVATNGVPQAVAAIVASTLILLSSFRTPLLQWFGDISYSLYLTHGFVIAIVVNQGVRILGDGYPAQILVIICSVLISLLAAFLLNIVVEVPAKSLSHRIRYPSDCKISA